jgi:hypothetical protein
MPDVSTIQGRTANHRLFETLDGSLLCDHWTDERVVGSETGIGVTFFFIVIVDDT